MAAPVWRSSSATAGNSEIATKPTGLTVDDLLVVFYEADDGSATATSPGSGWTHISGSFNSGGRKFGAFHKIATSTETAATTFTVGGISSSYREVVAICWSGSDLTTPISTSSIFDAPGASPTTDSLTTVTTCLEIAGCAFDNGTNGTNDTGGFTHRTLTGGVDWWVGEKPQAVAGTTGTTNLAGAGSPGTQGIIHFIIQPPSGAAAAPVARTFVFPQARPRATGW